jgi:hypothetical protein
MPPKLTCALEGLLKPLICLQQCQQECANSNQHNHNSQPASQDLHLNDQVGLFCLDFADKLVDLSNLCIVACRSTVEGVGEVQQQQQQQSSSREGSP